QSEPAVIASGLVVNERILATTAALWDKKGIEPVDEIRVLMRPSVICTRPLDPTSELYLVTPSFRSRPTEKDPQGEVVISNPATLRANLAARFNKPLDKVKIVEGCLPPGKYGMNLVYSTGQAWSLPNEAGRCRSPLEVEQLDSQTCKQEAQNARPILMSQRFHITLEGTQEEGYCEQIAGIAAANAASNGADLLDAGSYIAGIPVACLNAAEKANPDILRQKMSKIPLGNHETSRQGEREERTRSCVADDGNLVPCQQCAGGCANGSAALLQVGHGPHRPRKLRTGYR
ncbi:MAG: hypothetical protein NZX77_22525, partial [Polyangiaceae bacterium]|nr:hypothetical protein [Polyangiaceae bacterium]